MPRESRSIGELPEEEQAKIPELERATDDIYGLRQQLASFYREYRKYFPKGTRINDIAYLNIFQRDEQIRSDVIAAEIDQRDLPEDKKEKLKKWRRLQVKEAIRRGVDAWRELSLVKEGIFSDSHEDPSKEQKDIEDYYRMRFSELGFSIERLTELETRAEELETLRDLAHSDPDFTPHPDDIDALEEQYVLVLHDIKRLTSQSPEAYLFLHGRELKKAKQLFDAHGRIVETPFVKTKLGRVRDLVRAGRPVFIHGELGTGKTEFAKHASRTEFSKPYVARWEKAHPAPTDPKERTAWEAQRAGEAEALVISGHRGIEIEQILAARAITKKEPLPPEEQVRKIHEGWEEYQRRMLTDAEARGVDTADLKNKLETVDRPLYEKSYQELFRSPVETKTILAPLLRAMREGRPVVIDEVNAIPHHVLIVMNDLLLRRPGEMVTPPFPDMEPFQVQEGFVVFMTGNYKPEDGLMYIGRQPLDAAFLSRLGVVSYDYLPMQRISEPDPSTTTKEAQRDFRKQNELYHMLMTRLVDTDLSVKLPKGSFHKLRELCKVARHLQDIFSGSNAERGYYANVKGAEVSNVRDVLKENVLSIRHLIPIVEAWKRDGFRRELDDYLFLEYIARSNARPEEKLYLYRILQTQGDCFPDTKGWPALSEREKILGLPIDAKMYGVDTASGGRRPALPDRTAQLKTFSPKEVIEELFGPAPDRTVLPETYLERGKAPAAPQESPEDKLARERLLASLGGQVDKLRGEGFSDDVAGEEGKKGKKGKKGK